MRKQYLFVVVAFLIAVCFRPVAADDRPNILLILTDDQGWNTLGCYGGKNVDTPHLDRLAAEGVRFTSAYVTSQCTPTRATLLSGQYTARNRMWHVIRWYGCPWARMSEPAFVEQYPRDKATIASELQRAGYTTGIVGKWHLTNNQDGDYQRLRSEASRHYGFEYAAPGLPARDFQDGGDRGANTLTDQALEFIENHKDGPWFCYLSHHMIHGKVVAPKAIEAEYRDRGFGDEGPNRAIYLAGLKVIDDSVGKILKGLEQLGESDATVVIFLSDNGGIHERLEHRSLAKPHPAAPRFNPNMVEYDNAPLRDGKGSIYEGGVRVPMIVRWPNQASAGTVIDEPVHAIDLAPTLFSMAGHEPSEELNLDEVDLVPLLRSGIKKELLDRSLFQYSPFYDLNWGLTPCASVRRGRYKLIEFVGDRFDRDHKYVVGHRIELYDLKTDISEKDNLADSRPNLAEELTVLLHDWMKEMEVVRPGVNPHFDASRAFETTNEKPLWVE